MKIIFLLFCSLSFFSLWGLSQDIGGYKVGISNFVRRIYNVQAFEGVKILQTQDGLDYMVSVVALKKGTNKPESLLSRIASIKAKAFASQYVNGSDISSNVTIVTTDEKTKDSVITKTSIQEVLKETSIGFAEGMELLINFESNNGKQIVYVYFREIKK